MILIDLALAASGHATAALALVGAQTAALAVIGTVLLRQRRQPMPQPVAA